MDKRIVYTRADGGCSIVTPAPHGRRFVKDMHDGTGKVVFPAGSCLPRKAFTPKGVAGLIRAGLLEDDDAFMARIITGLPADAKEVRVADASEIPTDRTFRDAWRNNGKGRLEVNMPMARELWRDLMRAARAPRLAALDVEYQRADETGDTARKADVARRKQVLRDVTADPRIEASTAPDELKAVWAGVLA